MNSRILNHYISYLPTAALPAISGLLILYVLTRYLSPDEYGLFSVLFSCLLVSDALISQICQQILVRHFQLFRNSSSIEILLNNIGWIYASLFLLVSAAVGFLLYFWLKIDIITIVCVVLIIFFISIFGLCQKILVVNFESRKFSILLCVDYIMRCIFLFASVHYFSSTAFGALTGLCCAVSVSVFLSTHRLKLFIPGSTPRWAEIVPLLKFGWPISLQAGLSAIISRVDRGLLAGLGSLALAGIYNAAFSIAAQAILPIFAVIALVAHPRVIQAYENQPREHAIATMRENSVLFAAIAFPATVGVVSLASELSNMLIGADLRGEASGIIPVLALSFLISGIKDHFVTHGYHISRKTWIIPLLLIPVSVFSVGINIYSIPTYGIFGAAAVFLVSQTVSLWLLIVFSKWSEPLWIDYKEIGKVIVACCLMSLIVFNIPYFGDFVTLFMKVASGSVFYLICIYFLKSDFFSILKKSVGN